MPKIHRKRIGFKLDMTPMVDVGFLLLTFFMLTTQFKPSDDLEITLPSSHSFFKIPGADVITLSVGKDGQILLGVDSQLLREALFGQGAKLKGAVAVQPSDLTNLLIQARTKNPRLKTVIRADKDVDYGVIEDVMKILQKVNITRFNLVTELAKN
ncbi:MAG TPA: biopolymer transporter ExbD [Bacteroidota bacterium]|nr:biopolymer transporter ExbD [Bacteroidota bacterium]